MAARKTRPSPKRTPDVPPTPPPPSTAGVAETRPSAAATGRKSSLILPALVFAVWFAALAALALWTANPTTINRQQVQNADLVAWVGVEDMTSGKCRVLHTWPDANIGETITVNGLSDLSAIAGETYLIPLLRTSRGADYEVAPTHEPESPRLIYPATDDSRRQLEEALKQP